MTFLLSAYRWLGLKASVLALCALVAIAWGGWQRHTSASLAHALALSEARVSVLQAEANAANALAKDYEARADAARVAMEQAQDAAKKATAARARKWQGIRQATPAWSETPVPAEVVEGLR